ncbi:hypothetical protein BDV06DRAFT_4851 [Aspergillus oleicola]
MVLFSFTTIPLLVVVSFAYLLLWLFNPSGSGRADMGDSIDLSTPAVGIALTATFGTISIRHPNGSYQDLGRVDGDERYIAIMRRLSSPEAMHLAPPYSSMEEMWSDLPRQGPRAIKRALGLPASSDVKALSGLLKPLLNLYPPSKQQKVTSAVLSYPPLLALYEEDIIDAASYLNMRAQGGAHLAQPKEMVAAYAGYGRGFCDHPEKKEECDEQMGQLPEVDVLHLEVTSKAILVSVDVLREAKTVSGLNVKSRAFWELGCKDIGDADGDGYLVRLERYLASFLKVEYPVAFPRSMVVIFTGEEECVGDGGGQAVVRRVLERNGVEKIEVLDERPEYIAARGAAELCFRGWEYSKRQMGEP